MHSRRDDARGVEVDQQFAMLAFEMVLVRIGLRVGKMRIARGAVVGHVEQRAGEGLQFGRDLRVVQRVGGRVGG